jgi:hypothetical protein
MVLTTSLAGRVKNISLPKSHALLPLLEAAVNSIQAVDELRNGSENLRFHRPATRGQLKRGAAAK